MKNTITIEQARELLAKYVKEKYILDHSRETEVIMRALAQKLGEPEELWAVTGLLHDLDYEETKDSIEQHSLRTCEILKQAGFNNPEMFHAIKAHVEDLGTVDVKRKTKLDFALAAAESVTGLIYAYVLMRLDKKIEGAKPKSLTKKFKDKSFAAKVNRSLINDIEKTGLSRAEFFQISLDAMKSIAGEVGI